MKAQKFILPLMVILCIASMIVMFAVLAASKHKNFIPPSFEDAAIQGLPNVPEEAGWSPIEAAEAFTAYLCGNVIVKDRIAEVYFTSAEKNTAWIKLRILDEHGTMIGETGLLKPGEYVKDVTLTETLLDGAVIKLKIMAYEPDTYYSAGSAALNTTIKNGG